MKDIKEIGLFLGVLLFVICLILPAPAGMTIKAWHMVACVVLIAVWWMTEAINLTITALLPIILFPIMDITSATKVTLAYGNEVIFLFMGGFIIALALEKSNLQKRFALKLIKIAGDSPKRIILGFMIAVAMMSMWVSNTATVLIVIPIAMAIVGRFPVDKADPFKYNTFTKSLLLGIAYSASIGGVATLIGTPPNIIFASIASKTPEMDMTFVEWMLIGVPIAAILLIMVWILLVYFIFPSKFNKLPVASQFVTEELKSLGKMSKAEKRTLIVFICVAVLWVSRGLIKIEFFSHLITDTTIAIAGVIALFIIPAGNGKGALMDWKTASRLPWGILLLFGGGLALSDGFKNSGLTDYLVAIFESFKDMDFWLIALIIITFVIFLTEVMSNTATATLLIPIMISVSIALDVSPLLLTIPVTLATSFAFMLPVATPPNAIVFGYDILNIKDMVRAGFWVNIISIGLLLLATMYYLPYITNVEL